MSVMTREQVDELIDYARQCIAREMQRCEVSGSGGVVVNGDIVSLPALAEDEPVVRRAWGIAIFAQVNMTQNYGTSEPGQISDLFEYEPRYVTLLPSALTETDYFSGNSGVTMLPRIITDGAGPQAGEAYPGVVYQESVVVPTPSILDKFASITFYVRGYWADSQDVEPVFATGFPVGSVLLTLRQRQYITTGNPLEEVLMTGDSQVTATHAGASALFNAFPTDPFTPGDSTATIDIIGAQRPG